MVLVEFARLLKAALDASGSSDYGSAAESTQGIRFSLRRLLRLSGFIKGQSVDSTIVRVLRAQLGNTPEAANRVALVAHCVEAAKSVQRYHEMMLAELISTTLAFFMMRTVSPYTSGLVYSTRSHPLLDLVKANSTVFIVLRRRIARIVDGGL